MKLIVFYILFSLCFSAISKEKERNFKVPKRVISIIVSEEGFYPNSLSVFRGEEIELYATSVTDKPSCLMIKDHDVFLGLKKGEIKGIEFTVEKAGNFSLYCPSVRSSGEMVVIDNKKIIKVKRSSASVSEIDAWIPREY